jgi:predicted permease
LYPASFRREHAGAFLDVADDRWRRERAAGATAVAATATTLRILLTDTWTGARLAHRHRLPASPRSPHMIDRLATQFRLALRGLKRAPLVTLVATISLAIGIGANTAVFTVANALLFAPAIGVRDMDRLVEICRTDDGRGCDTMGYPAYLDLRDSTKTMSGVYAIRFEPRPMSLGGPDGAQLARTQQVSASFFDVVGARPAMGRLFRTADERQAAPLREVVLSHAFWRHQFNGAPDVVGRAIELNGDQYVVVGVAEEGFQGTTILSPDLWVPLTALGQGTSSADLLKSRESAWLIAGGRLVAGATVAQAQAETTAFMQGLKAAYPDIYKNKGLLVQPTRRLPGALDVVLPFFAILMGLVGLVLFVTCANLGGLLLARATSRSREIGVRLALGASRRSLVGMFLIEALALFLPGTALAFVVARVATTGLEAMTAQLPVPVAARLAVDWRVAIFTAVVVLVMAALTAAAPAWQSVRRDLVADLRRDAASLSWLRRAFVVAQVACCIVSIVMAGLLLRALGRGVAMDPGFRISNLTVASVDFGLAKYGDDRIPGAVTDLRDRLAAIPRVRSVAVGSVVPLFGEAQGYGDVRLPGNRAGDPLSLRHQSIISPEYLPTLGIPLVRGRNFAATDRAGGPFVAIVNERFARMTWPGADPIGQILEFGDFRPAPRGWMHQLTVVGVARDAKYQDASEKPQSIVYFPVAQQAFARPNFFIETSGPSVDAALSAAVRQILKDFDRRLPLIAMAPLRQYADVGLAPARIAASVAGLLGLLALGLAAIGLYGLTANLVSSRTREIGVRVALGADRRRIVWLVVSQGLRLACVGGAIGLALALGATRVLSDLLFGVSPLDPAAFGLTIVTVVAVALVATYVPARRAASINPIAALKVD